MNMICETGHSGRLPPLRLQWVDYRLIGSLATQLWTNLYSMEITSDECLTNVEALLSCRSNMDVARSFEGNEAQTFVDFLDRVSKLSCGTPRTATA